MESSDREKVRLVCLTDGEYMFGSEETPGWMIGQNEDMSCISPYPKESLWMMVKIPGGTRRHYNDELAVCAIGSHIV